MGIYSIFLSTLYVMSCAGWGGLALVICLSKAERNKHGGAFFLGSSFFLGMGGLYAVWLVLGICGALTFSLVMLGVGLGVCFFAIVLKFGLKRKLCREAKQLCRIAVQLPFMWKALICGIVAISFHHLLLSLLFSASGDAEACYAMLPKIFAYKHGLFTPPLYEFFVQHGFLAELHSTAIMVLGNEFQAAKVLNWYCLIGLCYFAAHLSYRCGGGSFGAILAVLFVSISFVNFEILRQGKTDVLAAGMGLCAICWMAQVSPCRSLILSFIAAVFCGLSVLSKLSYVPVIGMIVVVFVLWASVGFILTASRKPVYMRLIKMYGVLLFGFVATVSLNLLKNYVIFHDPWLPFSGPSLQQVWYNDEYTQYILGIYPLAVTFGRFPMQSGNLTPLVWSGVPFLFFFSLRGVRGRAFIKLFIGCLVAVGAWKIVSPSVLAPRYILAVLLAMIPCSAAAIGTYWHRRKPAWLLRMALLAVIALAGHFILSGNSCDRFSWYKSWDILWGNEKNILHEGYFYHMQAINNEANETDRVLLLGYYSFHLRADLICSLFCIHDFDNLQNGIQSISSEKASRIILDRLREQGIRYISIQYTHTRYAAFFNDVTPGLTRIFGGTGNPIGVFRITADQGN